MASRLVALAGALAACGIARPAIAQRRGAGPPPPAFVLPAPTGALHVGTTSWRLVDSSRLETFAAAARPREVEVLAWYPTALTSSGAEPQYLRETVAEARAFASLLRSPGVYDGLATVATHSIVDAPVIPGQRLPLLVFSHGYTGPASASTALLE